VIFLGEFSAPNDNSFLEKFGNFPLLRVKIGPEMFIWGRKSPNFQNQKTEKKTLVGQGCFSIT
jgi:hypothetical protein